MHSFTFPKHFPETQRAFADGELSVVMDRYGGILEMALIDILRLEGRDYPDNTPLPILSRRASTTSGRPLYGPALQLLTECSDGQMLYHEPASPEVFPWGVSGKRNSESFGMVLDHRRMLFRCSSRDERRKTFRIALSRHHFYNGKSYAGKNQRATDGCDLHYERAGLPFDPAKPVPNGIAEIRWGGPAFLAEKNTVVWNARIRFPYGEQELHLAASASLPLTMSESASLWILSADWGEADAVETVFALAATEEEALALAASGGADFAEILRRKQKEIDRLEKSAPALEIEGMPSAGEFLRASIGYQHSLLLKDTAGIRAAQHKFGAFILWDTLYPIRDLLWNGEIREAKKLFRSLLGYPFLENSAWVVTQLILVLDEILSFDSDDALVDEAWPYLMRYLDFMLKLTNRETGLVASCMNTGVDVPQELGLSGLYAAPCINGWWYGALRVMENLAQKRGDPSVSEKSSPLIPRIEACFLKGFLSPRTGYLRSGIREDLTPGNVEAFQNTSTAGLDYPFGSYLMRKGIVPMAEYQARRLYHPGGRTAVAWDTEIECEMWKSVHMNQHDGHEARLARLAGNLPEAYRLTTCYLEVFSEYGTAVETFNYSGCLGNETQTSDWQAFSATAVCEALRSGLAGIARHGGGLHYLPAEDHRRIQLKNLRWKHHLVHVEISGKGAYFLPMKINGKTLPGTAQLPADCLEGKNIFWTIRRSVRPFATPVLLNSFGLPVCSVCAKKDLLSFRTADGGHYPMEIHAGAEPDVSVNGIPVPFEYDPAVSRVWLDRCFLKGDLIEIRIP